jgi:hypothetical protein
MAMLRLEPTQFWRPVPALQLVLPVLPLPALLPLASASLPLLALPAF